MKQPSIQIYVYIRFEDYINTNKIYSRLPFLKLTVAPEKKPFQEENH